jgi:ADP-ribose pyrophosphatase
MEKWINSETVYEGQVVSLRKGEVELADGYRAFREVVQHPGGVGVVPFDGEHVILVRQYRIAVEREMLEVPAGKLEPGDSPEERGRAELLEEAGYVAGKMVAAGAIYASCGYTSELIHLYLALDLRQAEVCPEHDERIEVVSLSLDDVRERLARGAFSDAKTLIGLRALLDHLSSVSAG